MDCILYRTDSTLRLLHSRSDFEEEPADDQTLTSAPRPPPPRGDPKLSSFRLVGFFRMETLIGLHFCTPWLIYKQKLYDSSEHLNFLP